MDEDLLFEFLQATQEKEVQKLQVIHGNSYRSKVLYRLNNQIKLIGIIEVLRKGITDNNIKLKLFYDKPVSNLNEKTQPFTIKYFFGNSAGALQYQMKIALIWQFYQQLTNHNL